MRFTSYLIALCMVATPAIALAQNQPDQESPDQNESPDQDKSQDKSQDKAKMQPQGAEEKRQAEVKGHLLPMLVGTESATMCAAALHELAMMSADRENARKTTELADYAVKIAHDRAKNLSSVKGLSQEAQMEAKKATQKLAEARTTVAQIQQTIGGGKGMMESDKADKVRASAKELNASLSEARASIDKLAETYKVSLGPAKKNRVSSAKP